MSILDAFKLDGKVALVTGARRGLGQGMAVALAEAGADIAGLGSGPDAAETAALVEAQGRRFHYIAHDLAQATPQSLAGVVAEVEAALGGPDILLNNAGIIRRAPALDMAPQDWRDVVHVNLDVIFYLAQAAAQRMAANGGGKIINIASVLSFQGGITVAAYAAAKTGVLGLTRALANEWAGQGINVNAIAPGYMATSMTQALQNHPERAPAILARIPAGRWGTPEDLQGAAVYLASAASDYVHGTVVAVDGGWMAR